MIAFFIKFRGFLKDLVGAEFDTKPTALTAVFNDMQLPDRYGMGSGIQWKSPEFHPLFLRLTRKNYFMQVDQKGLYPRRTRRPNPGPIPKGMGLLRCFEREEIPRNEVRRGGQTGIFSSACNKNAHKFYFLI